MDITEYQYKAYRSYFGNKMEVKEQLINNALGLIGEVGEVVDQVKKEFYLGRKLTEEELIEELGDVMWHLCCFASARGINMDKVLEYNIQKLQRRYPDAKW